MSIWIPGGLSNNGGSSFIPPSWSDGTDEEIVTALEKHYAGQIDLTEYWSIGDTRQITLDAMKKGTVGETHEQQTVSFVLSNIGGKYLSDGETECLFQVDQVDCLNETGYMNNSSTNYGGWKECKRRTWCNGIYKNAIPSTIRDIFKEFINQSGLGNGSKNGVEDTTDYFALRAEIEVFGSRTYSVDGEGAQVDWYKTSSNRIKKVNNRVNAWNERSPRSENYYNFCTVDNAGNAGASGGNSNYGIAPFGVI